MGLSVWATNSVTSLGRPWDDFGPTLGKLGPSLGRLRIHFETALSCLHPSLVRPFSFVLVLHEALILVLSEAILIILGLAVEV